MDTLYTNKKGKIMWKAWIFPIILLVIIVSHSSCYTYHELSVQNLYKFDSLEVQNPENHIPVQGKGDFHSFTMRSGTTHKIPRAYRTSSYFFYQDTLRLILNPLGNKPGEKEIYYNIPVSEIDSITFRKFSFGKSSLIPVVLVGGAFGVLFLLMAIGGGE